MRIHRPILAGSLLSCCLLTPSAIATGTLSYTLNFDDQPAGITSGVFDHVTFTAQQCTNPGLCDVEDTAAENCGGLGLTIDGGGAGLRISPPSDTSHSGVVTMTFTGGFLATNVTIGVFQHGTAVPMQVTPFNAAGVSMGTITWSTGPLPVSNPNGISKIVFNASDPFVLDCISYEGFIVGFDMSLHVVAPSVYTPDVDALDVALGVLHPKWAIETFECGRPTPMLTPGLDLEVLVGDGAPPQILGPEESSGEAWDFGSMLWNHGFGPNADITFVVPGTRHFGVGISHLEQATSVTINGVLVAADIRTLPNFSPGGPDHRNGFLWVDAAGSQLIHSVRFHSVQPGSSDSIGYDHVVWDPRPCPADVNDDGVVNGADLAIILGAWGICPS